MKIEKIKVRVNRKPESKKADLFIDLDSIQIHYGQIIGFDKKPNGIKTADGYNVVKNSGIRSFSLVFTGTDWWIKNKSFGISFECDPELTKQLKTHINFDKLEIAETPCGNFLY